MYNWRLMGKDIHGTSLGSSSLCSVAFSLFYFVL